MKTKRAFWIILLTALMGTYTLRAQTFSEWFRQKKTQKKYLLQQIAALEVYMEFARKGYTIAREGLNLVEDFKSGEFNLHSDHFRSLAHVNPEIKQYARITEIMAIQYRMVRDQHQSLKHLRESGAFDGEELDYLTRVFEKTLYMVSESLDDLMAICTTGTLEMTDDARLERIDLLYDRTMEHYGSYLQLRNESTRLAMARLREIGDIDNTRHLYDLKQ
ncbi:hypothetical protein SAMN04487891_102381 [Flagellimonas taeanensis]|uniref:TerB family tellurite resistance protein n=1 Tax=Flagellimonas taeanensis TaxID=1005926 RepID=A0A1M6SAT1_9FLAO|nr:hypothetical protein [Allomuricauda taeanensis]SFB79613.1 hypothetical protein SAMN04487891_102381 [Allomuricauda taeanensis]SHK41883.1 hypothetical protein SAMN05216293_1060 [Allomuricauda taeanensis]